MPTIRGSSEAKDEETGKAVTPPRAASASGRSRDVVVCMIGMSAVMGLMMGVWSGVRCVGVL